MPPPSKSSSNALKKGHWDVENGLHLLQDREFSEDKHVASPAWGETWTVLTNMALSLTRLLRKGERTLQEIWERCRLDPTPVAERLGFKS